MGARPAHRPSRRAQILDVALAELCHDGANGGAATIGAIARGAGVTSAAMYYHFSSRSELLIALLDEIHPRLAGLFTAEDTDGESWPGSLLTRVADFVEQTPQAARFYFLIAPAIADKELAARCAIYREELLELLASGIARRYPGAPEVLVWVRSHALREVITCAIELGLQERDAPPRGFSALRSAGKTLAAELVDDLSTVAATG